MKRYLFILALVLVSCGGEVIVEPEPPFQLKYRGKVLAGLIEVDGIPPSIAWLDLRNPEPRVLYRRSFSISGSLGFECIETEETITFQSVDAIALNIKFNIVMPGDFGIDSREYLITYNLVNMDESEELPKGEFICEDLETGERKVNVCYFVPPDAANCPK